MPPKRVLIVIPNDFRDEARARFAKAQRADAQMFARVIRSLGHQARVLPMDLVEPESAYALVSKEIRKYRADAVIERCYLWADPPNGQAVTLAMPPDMPLGVSAYIAPLGKPLGEAPGEVFQLHTTCANRMVGRDSERLFGPLEGQGSDQTMQDLKEFLENGRIVSDIEFTDFQLPIKKNHTARARQILDSLRGKLVAMTGQPSMGMLPCNINIPWHCSAGTKGGWGMNIPIKSPDLAYILWKYGEDKAHYDKRGHEYVRLMKDKGFDFRYTRDWDNRPLPEEDIGGLTPEIAAFQMALYAVLLDIIREQKIAILGIPAQLVWTDHVVCGDLIKGVATSSWGPEGRNTPLRWETEGDIDGGISEYLLHKTTGNAPGFADVRCFIPQLNAWMMCNSGQCCADLAEGGWKGCFSTPQYTGYFRSPRRGGTFAFRNPKACKVVGLRVAVDQEGVYGTVSIGQTVRSNDPRTVVDGRWPQLKIKVFDGVRKTRFYWPTNHYHWAESADPINDACILYETLRLSAGGDAGRVRLLYDGRTIK